VQDWNRERDLLRQVTDLALIGVRPNIIRRAIGSGVSLAEITRIFRLTTPIASPKRRGRVISATYIWRMPPAHLMLYAKLAEETQQCMAAGASRADALAAVWRLEAGRRNLAAESPIDGARLEDLVVLYLGLEAGELGLSPCAACAQPLLTWGPQPDTCPTCRAQADSQRS